MRSSQMYTITPLWLLSYLFVRPLFRSEMHFHKYYGSSLIVCRKVCQEKNFCFVIKVQLTPIFYRNIGATSMLVLVVVIMYMLTVGILYNSRCGSKSVLDVARSPVAKDFVPDAALYIFGGRWWFGVTPIGFIYRLLRADCVYVLLLGCLSSLRSPPGKKFWFRYRPLQFWQGFWYAKQQFAPSSRYHQFLYWYNLYLFLFLYLLVPFAHILESLLFLLQSVFSDFILEVSLETPHLCCPCCSLWRFTLRAIHFVAYFFSLSLASCSSFLLEIFI